jgi:intracellular sulfur oxidation DsrE/DsrF family protein
MRQWTLLQLIALGISTLSGDAMSRLLRSVPPLSLLAGFLLAGFLLGGLAVADANVERLLAGETAPSGVVFEVLEDDEVALAWALPAVKASAERLRARFPGLPVAVVTHGQEQFGLLSIEASGPLTSIIHSEAETLGGSKIDLHVCGAHAGWYGHGAEDFPDFVDVTPSGPALLNDYRALGYEVIRLEAPAEP